MQAVMRLKTTMIETDYLYMWFTIFCVLYLKGNISEYVTIYAFEFRIFESF